jgi:hypothetical protein
MASFAVLASRLLEVSGQRSARWVAAIVVALCIGLVPGASPAAAADRGVNFTGYCVAHYSGYGVRVTAWHAWVGSWTAVTWRCRQSAMAPTSAPQFASIFRPVRGVIYHRDYQIDVNAVCRWQYGSRSYSKLLGQSWADWRCVA